MLIAGPSYMPAAFRDTPLARLLPFAVDRVRYPAETLTEGFVVQPTDLGLASPAMQLGDTPEETQRIWKDLPPLYWLLEVARAEARRPRPGRTSHARRSRRPPPARLLLPVRRRRQGPVPRHRRNLALALSRRRLYFARYWIQTIRYLCRSKLADAGRSAVLTTDRREYAQGDSVRLRVRFADERLAPADDDGVTIVVEQSGRKTQRVSLHRTAAGRGVFEGVLDRPGPGKLSRLDRRARRRRPIARRRFHRSSAARRVRPGPHGRRRHAPRRRDFRRPILHASTPPTACSDDLPPGRQVPIESLPPPSLVEPLARARAVPRPVDRRMDITKTSRNGVE